MFHIFVITLLPDVFPGTLDASCFARARAMGLWDITLFPLRDFAYLSRVDDKPFGGGPGMIVRPDVAINAIDTVVQEAKLLTSASCAATPIVHFSPHGEKLTQEFVKKFSQENDSVIIFCSRFEGIDARIYKLRPIINISIGDYITAGGEVAAMVFLETVLRLKNHVMNNNQSSVEESFENDLLEYPQYTRPSTIEGEKVPEILLSGHHTNIKKWRMTQAQVYTKINRPDLWKKFNKNKE